MSLRSPSPWVLLCLASLWAVLASGCGEASALDGTGADDKEESTPEGRKLGDWTEVTSGVPAGAHVLAFAHLDGATFALLEVEGSRTVLRLEDEGRTWQPHPPEARGAELLQSLVRLDRSLYLAAADAKLGQGSLYRLDFADEPWKRLDTAPALSVSAVTQRRGALLAAFFGPASGAQGPGLYASTDRGLTWQRRAAAEGGNALFASSIRGFVSSSASQRFFAIGDAASGHSGLFLSDDEGRTWARAEPKGDVKALEAKAAVVLGEFEGAGAQRSNNFGSTWHPMVLGEGVVARSFTLSSDDISFAGTNRGLYVSRDGGRTWEASNAGPLAGRAIDVLHLAGSTLFASSGPQIFAAPLE